MFTMSIVPSDDVLVGLIARMRAIGTGAGLENTQSALDKMAQAIATKWQRQVGDKNVIERPIVIDPFTRRVYSKSKMVHWLEEGLPAYDMRQTHTHGPKSRVVKPRLGPGGKLITQWKVKNPDGSYRTVMAGSAYAIIPFHHHVADKGTDNNKKLGDVYNDVRRQMKPSSFKRSYVTKSPANSNTSTPNAMGDMVKRAEYEWGARLEFPDEPEFKNLQGMVPMNDPKQSQYMSFRVVSVNSPASTWQHPGIKARHYLKNILDEGQEQIANVIEAALGRDFGSNSI